MASQAPVIAKSDIQTNFLKAMEGLSSLILDPLTTAAELEAYTNIMTETVKNYSKQLRTNLNNRSL